MKYTYTDEFVKNNWDFLLENMMGPNSIRVLEELSSTLKIDDKTRILDLGCGAGLSSIMLAEKYGATVYAADLWISPTDNYQRFKQRGLEGKIIPLSVDARQGLPFAQEYFDIVFSVDAYHYFGTTEEMLPLVASFVKKGGYVAVAVPGLQEEFKNGHPPELVEFFPEEPNFHSVNWWQDLWCKADNVEFIDGREMACHKQAWAEWLQSSNPHAVGDVKMMAVENDRYFNHVQLIAKRI